ncbi:hypothetical protein GQ44DRAFT_192456 [Phaeosphaeriaceae sp. PMI808]|nr:hypothetical protein GQ44DRAFT_192456 [Phaeosphaeriaceae sp. PMI808]
MAVLEAILPVAGHSSVLALELYRVAALSQDEAARDSIQAASAINNFASILKQIGTIIKEDDRLPSHEATEILEDAVQQSQSIYSEFESLATIANGTQNAPGATRLAYLTAHLEAIRATLSVLLQTLYTAQSIIWSKLRPTISPFETAKAVANEKLQLETLIIEQQILILSAIRSHEKALPSSSNLLMEEDSCQSLVLTKREGTPSPSDLYRYQDEHVASLDSTSSTVSNWLFATRNITSLHIERVLARWTCLPQIDHELGELERETRSQQRELQQPSVESDSEDDCEQQQKLEGPGARTDVPPQRSGSIQPLFTEVNPLLNPGRDANYGPIAPLSPAASPTTSRNTLAAPSSEQDSPVSPRSSIGSLPVAAKAAIEAQEEDEDMDLEIPWQLCTRKYYWKYIDGKMVNTNTDQLPSLASLERNSWTEIMASWVCKEAIRERGYRFTQVQKERKDGRRTRFETCFCIEQPLQFEKVKQLVERTVQIYREKRPPSPPPRSRRSSFQRPHAVPLKVTRANEIDRDRTPVPKMTHPPMGGSSSSTLAPFMAPPLDRSLSMPGHGSTSGFQAEPKFYVPNLHIPMPPGPYSTSMPQGPCSPQIPCSPYSPQPYNVPNAMYPSNPTFSNATVLPPHLQQQNTNMSHSPVKQGRLHQNTKARYDDDFISTDSDSGKDRRRRRSRSRSRYSSDTKKKNHNKKKAAGVLMGVGGLTALLDGLGGL